MTFYLYGHYDSRGGASLIEAPTREKADENYAESFFNRDEEWATKAEQDKQIIEEDFIDSVTFESYRPIEEGEDLEQGDKPDGQEELAMAFEDGLAWATDEIQATTANPYQELLWWHEESKTLRLCPKGVNPGDPGPSTNSVWPRPERIPGWKRSELGEDAFGVVFIRVT